MGWAHPAWAFVPVLPGEPVQTAHFQEGLGSYQLPIGPWSEAGMAKLDLEGSVEQISWRTAATGFSTLSILTPIRDQLAAEGWVVLFECETTGCGGFDFRYGTEVLPEPDMHIDLTDFRFLSAKKADGSGHLSVMVSRSSESGFVQLIEVGPARVEAEEPVVPDLVQPITPVAPSALGTDLETGGAVALDDLVFASGKSDLAAGEYASLQALADYLAANPGRGIALVGHTDASGSLASNVALSRKRAASVRARLIEEYGATGSQIIADGVGFLAPRASNLTEEGRTANRRVEVMLTSTE